MQLTHLLPLPLLLPLLLLTTFTPLPIHSSPTIYGTCQSRCANNLLACYAAGGSVFGTVTTTADVIPEQMVCNADYSNCQVDCIDGFIEWAKGDLVREGVRGGKGLGGPTRTRDCFVVQP